MKVKQQSDACFTTDQETWIVSQFHQGFSSTQVKRNYRQKFGFSTKVRKLQPVQFERVFKRLFTDQDLVKKIILNIRKRAKLCVEQKGGHFEHLLKLKNYENEE